MKIIAAGNSKNLRKEDVPHQFIAIISDVRVQTFEKTARSPREDKDMLHFADPNVKPLGLNVTNKRVLVAAYGDESDNWRGQPVEIYVDPNVTNSRGEIVGGIRLRIPRTAAAIGATTAPAAAQASRPMPALQSPRNAEVTRTAAEVAQAIEGMNHAQEQENLEEWRSWGIAIAGTTPVQKDAMDAAFDHAQERLAIADAPGRAPPPGAGPGVGSAPEPSNNPDQGGRTMRPLFVVGIRHRPSPRELPSFHKYLYASLLMSKRRRESKSRGQTHHKLFHDKRLRPRRAENALFRGNAQFL